MTSIPQSKGFLARAEVAEAENASLRALLRRMYPVWHRGPTSVSDHILDHEERTLLVDVIGARENSANLTALVLEGCDRD